MKPMRISHPPGLASSPPSSLSQPIDFAEPEKRDLAGLILGLAKPLETNSSVHHRGGVGDNCGRLSRVISADCEQQRHEMGPLDQNFHLASKDSALRCDLSAKSILGPADGLA
jgi:hypothetical protein